MKNNSYRDGRVHVMRTMCKTCVFRPGNLMSLRPGRLADLIRENEIAESALTCHSTLDTKTNAVCRGFFDRHPTQPLQVAERLGFINWQEEE